MQKSAETLLEKFLSDFFLRLSDDESACDASDSHRKNGGSGRSGLSAGLDDCKSDLRPAEGGFPETLKDGSENPFRIGSASESALFEMLRVFVNQILFFNPAYKLVSVKTEEELIERHIADSLAPAALIFRYAPSKEIKFADLGSGAGLPGIPLSSFASVVPALQGVRCTLVERMGRRAGFLRNSIVQMKLTDRVQVVEKDLSDVRETFDIITFRAFRRLKDVAEGLKKITRRGSEVYVYKRTGEDIRTEIDELNAEMPGVFKTSVLPYKTFTGDEAFLLNLTGLQD